MNSEYRPMRPGQVCEGALRKAAAARAGDQLGGAGAGRQHQLGEALYCTVLYYTVLYCTVLYCTVLYCTVWRGGWSLGSSQYILVSRCGAEVAVAGHQEVVITMFSISMV